MRTAIRYLLPIMLLGFVAGCSVFGIATKGDLKKQNEAMVKSLADQEQATNDRMAKVSGQLEAIEIELYAAMADLDSRNEATANDVADMRIHFEIIQGQLQLALADLESVAAAASRAEAGSQQAVQLHQDAILAERIRLQDRLRELEVRISTWSQTPVPGDQLQRELQPEVENTAAIQSAAVQSSSGGSLPRPGLQIPDSARNGR